MKKCHWWDCNEVATTIVRWDSGGKNEYCFGHAHEIIQRRKLKGHGHIEASAVSK